MSNDHFFLSRFNASMYVIMVFVSHPRFKLLLMLLLFLLLRYGPKIVVTGTERGRERERERGRESISML